MRFNTDKCPKCGASPLGTIEDVSACAWLEPDESGGWRWEGYTDIHWDTQKTRVTDGKVTLSCSECDNSWDTEMEELHPCV